MYPIRCEKLLEGNGIIVLPVLGAVDERHRAVAHMRHELLDRRAILLEFLEVASPERGPFRRVVAEPLPEHGTRCDLFEPEINARRTLRHAPRPEPVDQDPKSIVWLGRLIRSLQADHHETPSAVDCRGRRFHRLRASSSAKRRRRARSSSQRAVSSRTMAAIA